MVDTDLSVIANKSCSKNADLLKSIQYQLKLVENTDGQCGCETNKLSKLIQFVFLFFKFS